MISLGIAHFAKSPDHPLPFSQQVLSEAQTWCSSQASLAHNLRSPDLDPSKILDIPWLKDTHKFVQRKYESYRLAVTELIGRRSALVLGTVTTSESTASSPPGRILIYFPLETVSDGAAEASSSGFFDTEDAPPWDTWLVYSEGAILSWVPESMTSRAQAGIDANPVDCIHWAKTNSFSAR